MSPELSNVLLAWAALSVIFTLGVAGIVYAGWRMGRSAWPALRLPPEETENTNEVPAARQVRKRTAEDSVGS